MLIAKVIAPHNSPWWTQVLVTSNQFATFETNKEILPASNCIVWHNKWSSELLVNYG